MLQNNYGLNNTDLHIWWLRVSALQSNLSLFWDLLNSAERLRADRFVFSKDHDSFVIAHGALKQLLGRYLQVPAATIAFSYNEYGKPELSEAMSSKLEFNISHSRDLAIIALVRDRKVGVDVEYVLTDRDYLSIAQRFFSAHEIMQLRTLSCEQQSHGFYNCWTRKEAYIKALGKGLSYQLSQFDVDLLATSGNLLLADRGQESISDWSLLNLSIAPDYVAAVAVHGQNLELVQHELRPEQFF